ncbi:hypothetical protein BDR07DRAFT_676892 [Suillus spraguei]|nr:hypothetical protein BDR07DRAFT_676892 [Suillus spraguei]
MHISTTSIPCSDIRMDTPTSASIQRPLPILQPKRQSLTSSLSEHLKHCDLEWFKAHHQPAASPDSKPLSPAAPGPPSAPNVSNDVTGPPAERIQPSRMPGRIPLRPASTEPTPVNEPAAPANAVDLPSTSSFTEISVPTDAKELNQEEIVPTMVDVVMNDSQRQHVPQGSETLLLDTPGDVVPKLTTPPEPNTDSLAPSQPPAISSDAGAGNHGDEILLSPVDNTPSQAACARFGGEMAVMMFRQGLESPPGTINLTFNLDHTLYLQIARWAKRKSSPTDLEQSVCVSFACYHLPSLLPNPPEDGLILFGWDSHCDWSLRIGLSGSTG